ncbi:MAG: metallophosphoesterase [Oscillospiraceae bacterium]|nr:metallophosphoesterase [Oscillospiraceae bacterium]
MSIYTLGDLHLSLSTDKPMDIFPGWGDYIPKIKANWEQIIKPEDTVVIPGDVSWAMGLAQCEKDFAFINDLPGQKILLKGNHDYWWSTKRKMDDFLAEKGFHTIKIISNNSYVCEGVNICGTRGWFTEEGGKGEHDDLIRAREIGRLKMSLDTCDKDLEKIVFLHYPPIYRDFFSRETIDVLHQYGVTQCYYGHIHGKGIRFAFEGEFEGIAFHLVSGDSVGFVPVLVKE